MVKILTDKYGLVLNVGDVVEYQKRHFTIKFINHDKKTLIFENSLFQSQPIPSHNVALISRNKFMSKK